MTETTRMGIELKLRERVAELLEDGSASVLLAISVSVLELQVEKLSDTVKALQMECHR